MRLSALLFLAFALACTPSGASTDTAANEQAIRGIVDNWNAALSNQNDSLISLIYAEDAVLLPPAMPRVTGRIAIRAFWARLWPMKAALSLSPVTIRVFGDWAIEEGNWNWTMPSPQGEIRDHGKYLVTWHRSATSWEVVQDIWNSDSPPPAPVPN